MNSGERALKLASEKNGVEVVSLLLNAGADVHAWNEYALQWASYYGHVEVVYLLLGAGVDPKMCSEEMLEEVKDHVCSQLNGVDLPTCLKNNVICKFLIG